MTLATYSVRVTNCCLTILGRHHEGQGKPGNHALLVAEVELIAAGLMALEFPASDMRWSILAPLEAALVDHHGPLVGQQLNDEFVTAFVAAWAALMSRMPPHRRDIAIR